MMRGIGRSITFKWMAFSILLATVPLAISGYSIIQIYQKNEKKSIVEFQKEKAILVVEKTRGFMEKITDILFNLAKEEHYWTSLSNAKGHLKKLLYQRDYFSELSLLDEKGWETVRVSKQGQSDLRNRSDSEMFKMTSMGRIYYGDFYFPPDGVLTIGVAVPVQDYAGKPVGVLSARVQLRYLSELMKQTKIGEKGFAYVVDREGFLIAQPEGVNILLGPFVDRVIAGEEGSLEFENLRGQKYLVVYKPIPELKWGVVVQVPTEEAYASLKEVASVAIKWILISLCVAFLISLFFTRRLVRPIKQLSSQMARVSAGDLDVHIETHRKDEVGYLTESFNRMIRDLKKSQDALKEAEAKYRTIFEKSRDMVYMTSFDGKFIDVNQAGVDIFNYASKEELMQTPVRDFYLNPEERKRFQNEIAKEGFIKDFEIKFKRKDGTPIDVLITATVRKDGEGHILGYEGSIKDISVRKEMEEDLLKRKEELQALYDLSVLINQSLDLNDFFPIALERASNLTGFEMGGIYLYNEDRGFLELKSYKGYSTVLAESVKVLKYGEGVCGRAVELKRPIVLSINEYPSPRILPSLKEEGIQTLVGVPLLSKGKAIGAVTLSSRSLRNLTQREINLLESVGNQIGLALENAKLFSDVAKAKSEWETTFDSVTDLITIRDRDYRMIRANKAAFKRYGLKPEQMIGKRCFETLHQSNQPCEGCYVSKTLETQKPESGERDSKYLNGIFQYYTFPIYNETGGVVAVVDLAREITEEKRLEMEKEVVNNINKILASSLDVRQVIKAIHSELKKIFDSKRMTITLLNEGREGFQYFALEKDYEDRELSGGVIYPKEGTPFAKAIETGLPVIVPDTERSDSWVNQKLLKEGIRSSLVFPLEYKGKVIGTMNFGNKETNYFSDHHVDFLRFVAPGLAISIQNALLFEETIKRLNELTILYEIMKISASSLNLDKMLREVMNSLNNFFKFEALGILLVDENTKRLLPHPASYNELSIKNIGKLGLSVGKGITGWVAEKGEPLLVNDVSEDSRYVCGDESVCSEICVPLRVGQKVIGVIDAQSKALNAFSEGDLRLLNIVGGQLATLIENIHLQEEINQSEEKYRTVVEGVLDGIAVVGRDFKFKYVNNRLSEILGYTKEELEGMDFRNVLTEESRQFVADRYVKWVRKEEDSPYFEFNFLRKDGEIRNIEMSNKEMRDSEGTLNFISIIRDITEKKRMEEQLLQVEKLRSLGEMASGVAHDFNNALAAILGNTQLLLYTAQDEETREALKTIEKVTRDSAQTVKRLQEFTRKRARQELFKLDVNSIVKDAIEITKPKWRNDAQGKGIHIEVLSSLGEVPSVVGDASELREVITNLIFNAVEAIPQGGTIEFRTFRKRGDVHIRIADTGIGMTEEVRKKIFEPFFTTKPFSNTGLGLSMSYGIIRRFNGEITVESKVGSGTAFSIVLPVALEGKEAVAPHAMIKPVKPARILVIDDEATVREVLEKMLSQVDHRVTVARNGDEGIRLFQEKEFDIVLTDLGMPDMSGWEVCQKIKKMNPYTPVGMITGWGMEVSQSKMEECGLDFIIAKPFDFNQIIRVVSEKIEPRT